MTPDQAAGRPQEASQFWWHFSFLQFESTARWGLETLLQGLPLPFPTQAARVLPTSLLSEGSAALQGPGCASRRHHTLSRLPPVTCSCLLSLIRHTTKSKRLLNGHQICGLTHWPWLPGGHLLALWPEAHLCARRHHSSSLPCLCRVTAQTCVHSCRLLAARPTASLSFSHSNLSGFNSTSR